MRVRMTAVAGIATAALILYGLSSGAATASRSGHEFVSVNATGVRPHSIAHLTKQPKGSLATKCGTSFGAELPTPDGIISWNDTNDPQTRYVTSGAADFTCSVPTTIHQVWAYGYFGTKPTDMFNVTFYYNDTTDSSNEPDDSDLLDGIACHFSNIAGAAGGDGIHGPVLTKLKFGSCKLPAGRYWVALQNNNPASPWYWEMQAAPQGDAPDWRDVNNMFGDACTTFDGNDSGSNGGDEYLLGCLGYDYGDYMFVLK